MTIKRYLVGRTYNVRRKVSVSKESLSTQEGASILFDCFREIGQSTTIEGRIAPAVSWSTATLERAQMPNDPNAPIYSEHDWLRANERRTAEWYAIKILQSVSFLRTFIQRGDANLAADVALDVAEIVTEGKFIFGYFGRNASEGGNAKAADVRPEAEARILECRRQATKLWRDHPDWTASDVARHIKVAGATGKPLSAGYVRKKIADLRSKKR
jgi:hypothetical protein